MCVYLYHIISNSSTRDLVFPILICLSVLYLSRPARTFSPWRISILVSFESSLVPWSSLESIYATKQKYIKELGYKEIGCTSTNLCVVDISSIDKSHKHLRGLLLDKKCAFADKGSPKKYRKNTWMRARNLAIMDSLVSSNYQRFSGPVRCDWTIDTQKAQDCLLPNAISFFV